MGFGDTTLALSPALKEELRSLKVVPEETFASVLRRIIDDAAKVSELEARIQELENEIESLRAVTRS